MTYKQMITALDAIMKELDVMTAHGIYPMESAHDMGDMLKIARKARCIAADTNMAGSSITPITDAIVIISISYDGTVNSMVWANPEFATFLEKDPYTVWHDNKTYITYVDVDCLAEL